MQANWIGKSEGCESRSRIRQNTRALMGGDGALKVSPRARTRCLA
jgi:hypothetical protein